MIKNIFKKSLLFTVGIILLSGCGENKIDVLSYPQKIRTKVIIPKVCEPEYKLTLPTIAISNFTNNSTFGKATINDTTSKSNIKTNSATIGAVVPSYFGVGVATVGTSKSRIKSKTNNVKRNVDAKLSESITGALESLVSSLGGVKLFTRTEIDKIDAELKFQDSGLVDLDSVVDFGKISGVRYLITGSIDNVELKYRNNSKITHEISKIAVQSKRKKNIIAGALLNIGTLLTDGMFITSTLTVKMLDVQTGKIILSKQVVETVNVGNISEPSYDQIIGGVKSALLKSLPLLQKDFENSFTMKGYIVQLRINDDDIIAQINIGEKFKIVENQLFKVYSFDEIEDPIDGSVSCDIIETNLELRASQQITKNTTWTTLESGEAEALKLGQLVKTSYKKAGD